MKNTLFEYFDNLIFELDKLNCEIKFFELSDSLQEEIIKNVKESEEFKGVGNVAIINKKEYEIELDCDFNSGVFYDPEKHELKNILLIEAFRFIFVSLTSVEEIIGIYFVTIEYGKWYSYVFSLKAEF